MPSVAVSIVVANWEGEACLERCLSSLQVSARQSGRSWELIVVDDASGDGSVRLVRERFPRARLLVNQSNRGFARTVARGVAAARGRVLILANNDILAREDFIGRLAAWFDVPAAAGGGPLFGVSARTVGWYDGRPNQLCMGAVWRGGRITPAWSDPGEARSCLFVQAGAAAYDMALYRRLGGLSPMYEPGYWEDYDLSWRARARGWRCLYDPAAFALHVGGGSMTRRFGADGVARMKARNHLVFEAANLRSPRLLAEWALRLPLGLARDLRLPAGQRVYTSAVQGMIRRLPALLAARLRARAVVPDERLLQEFRDFEPSH